MAPLLLHDFHAARGATFQASGSGESVAFYGSVDSEYLALTQSSALIDLSFRSRLCLLGTDREKFLHGQVTNEILRLNVGQGTYAALVTSKGKIETDLFIYKLNDELLLDFEPGLAEKISARLEKYIIAEDVQIIDVTPHYSLLSLQGPRSGEALQSAALAASLPISPLGWTKETLPGGDLYITANGRYGSAGFDLFVPNSELQGIATRLSEHSKWIGIDATEIARIENAIPRFGVDMDESNLAPEALAERAISYTKGCYIGQEVIARIRTYGQVAKALRLIQLPATPEALPQRLEKLFQKGREVGYITSSTISPKHAAKIALAFVRKEANALGESLQVGAPEGAEAKVLALPEKT